MEILFSNKMILALDFNKYGKVPVKDDDRFVPHLGKMPSYLVNSGHN